MNRTHPRPRLLAAVAAFALVLALAPAMAQEKADLAAIARIKDEGLNRSQVMETALYLSDVCGPRLSGSPGIRRAQAWAQERLKAWGLANVHAEPFPFGRGWELKRLSAHMLEPNYAPLAAFPPAWTPGTNGPVKGEVVRVEINSEAEFERYRGQLKGRFVLTQPPREVEAQFSPVARRYTEEELRALALAPEPQPRGAGGRTGPGGRAAPGPGRSPAPARSRRFAGRLREFLAAEGVAALIEPSRGDGGTLFVAGSSAARERNPAPAPPQLALAVEQYNRICRLLEQKIRVVLEVEVAAEFLDQDPNDYNVIAEIPGTDKKDEVVMVGAHLDSWHAATGATDNAAGCAVAMEVMRILLASGLRPRRTIRLALWSGEEQGLLGSRAYVSEHFASRPGPRSTVGTGLPPTPPPGGSPAATERPGRSPAPTGRPAAAGRLVLKPAHARFSGYFNLDNGTGKIRGIYLQGNEAARPLFEAWLAPFRDMGVTTVTIRNTSGTDHQSFDAVGLPGFQFIQDQVEYFSRTHHSNQDGYDRLQPADLMQAAVVKAALVYHTAMREEKLPRKPLRAGVRR